MPFKQGILKLCINQFESKNKMGKFPINIGKKITTLIIVVVIASFALLAKLASQKNWNLLDMLTYILQITTILACSVTTLCAILDLLNQKYWLRKVRKAQVGLPDGQEQKVAIHYITKITSKQIFNSNLQSISNQDYPNTTNILITILSPCSCRSSSTYSVSQQKISQMRDEFYNIFPTGYFKQMHIPYQDMEESQKKQFQEDVQNYRVVLVVQPGARGLRGRADGHREALYMGSRLVQNVDYWVVISQGARLVSNGVTQMIRLSEGYLNIQKQNLSLPKLGLISVPKSLRNQQQSITLISFLVQKISKKLLSPAISFLFSWSPRSACYLCPSQLLSQLTQQLLFSESKDARLNDIINNGKQKYCNLWVGDIGC